jgi:hypothetical protein
MDPIDLRRELTRAVELALADDWEGAHRIVQVHENDAMACWIHAVLHKIEGDKENARYWYAQAGQAYEAYADPKAELATLKAALTY